MSTYEWVEVPAPELDGAVEMLQPADVKELHEAVVQRLELQAAVCVAVRGKDGELAAYLRALRAEHPEWRVVSVIGDRPAGCPVGGASEGQWEAEWRLHGGRWAVLRAVWLALQAPSRRRRAATS